MILFYLTIIATSFCGSVCLDKYIEPPEIFGFYYNWLLKIGHVELNEDGTVKSMRKFIKAIGFCIICSNVWFSGIVIASAYLLNHFGIGNCPYFNPIMIPPTVFIANCIVIKFG